MRVRVRACAKKVSSCAPPPSPLPSLPPSFHAPNLSSPLPSLPPALSSPIQEGRRDEYSSSPREGERPELHYVQCSLLVPLLLPLDDKP